VNITSSVKLEMRNIFQHHQATTIGSVDEMFGHIAVEVSVGQSVLLENMLQQRPFCVRYKGLARILFAACPRMRMQMLAKPSSDLLQRTGGDHRGGHTQPG